MTLSKRTRLLLQTVVVGAGLLGCYFGGQSLASSGSLPGRRDISVRKEALPRAGKQLVLVYVGSSRCNPSNQTDVIAAIASAMDSLRLIASRQSMGFVSIGVARELSPGAGLMHLEKIGSFDEIAVGQGDLNQASMRLISVDHPGLGATPQLIIMERELTSLGKTIDNVHVRERVLARRVGAAEIRRWVERGTPLPGSVQKTTSHGG